MQRVWWMALVVVCADLGAHTQAGEANLGLFPHMLGVRRGERRALG